MLYKLFIMYIVYTQNVNVCNTCICLHKYSKYRKLLKVGTPSLGSFVSLNHQHILQVPKQEQCASPPEPIVGVSLPNPSSKGRHQ